MQMDSHSMQCQILSALCCHISFVDAYAITITRNEMDQLKGDALVRNQWWSVDLQGIEVVGVS